MSGAAKQRLQALSQQLVEGIPDAGSFEGMPKIRQVAGDSVGPRVKDKVAIVTGANSIAGIGRAAAHLYAANGAKAVYICDFSTSNLDAHARELNTLYPSVSIHVHQFDAADSTAVSAVITDAITRYGRLDIYFANAGIVGQPKLFTDITSDEFMSTLRTNTLGVFLAVKHAAAGMRITSPQKQYPGGSIICTASVAGLRSNAGSTDYSASKAAVVSIAQTCAYQLTGSGVRVNAICPGLIETGMTQALFDTARERGTQRKIGQLNPLQRGAVADEVARVALFLGSDESSYVNGQAWAVCGGLSAGHPFVPGKLA
ncbi:dehydrogenase with different specificitie [Aspergillus steynii IBT 23096]|uniref:Dehydrogenase with different specificitie n=1 Tax=Aspergillus steynii IBT 23096 TaxID=1392250 RepID=A0A2I2FUY4_9EURO|nr:dehydrogenase with different specificitie [Aspergillus steynii IBT 23096]PLB44455.1 dehydrogenase with different specificitie [Aspergillus steynii IBT 23096]